jgi:hypothetical protein
MPTNLLVNRNDYQSGNPTVFNTKQVDFDGSDDYLNISNSDSVNVTTNDFSVSAWFKTTEEEGMIFAKRADAGYEMGLANGKVSYYMKDAANNAAYDTEDTITVNDGEWHHIAWVFDRSGLGYRYIDGVNSGTNDSLTGATGSLSNTMPLGIMARLQPSPNSFIGGELSQVGLWNSTLTADEVSSLYNHGLPVDLNTDQAAYTSSSNLVGYWRMGSGTLDTYPLIADQTNATLGSELVVNGDFATDSNWVKGANTTISGGKLNSNSAGVYIIANQSGILAQNQVCKYSVTYTITSGSVRLGDSSSVWAGSTQSTSGTYTGYITVASTANGTLFFTSSASDFVGSIDNVSVKQVNGNPAIMTNMTASDIENGSPYANIVQNSDFATDTDWTKGSNWTISGGSATSDGTDATSNLSQTISSFNGKSFLVEGNASNVTQGYVYVSLGGSDLQIVVNSNGAFKHYVNISSGNSIFYISARNNFIGSIDNVTVEEVNTGLQGYWKMGSGINDEYPVIYDQTNPTLGAEIVVNGDFATDSDWIKQTGWTIANGKASISGQTQNRGISQDISVEAGKVYKVIYERTYISGNGETNLYSDFISDGVNTTLGSYSDTTQETVTVIFYFSPTYTGTMTLRVYAIGTFTGSIDNVSVKQVQGNPATMTNMVEGNITNQYPLTKIRNYYRMGDGILDKFPNIQDQTSPNLAHIPTTNLVTYSQDLSQWTTVTGGGTASASVTPNYGISPDGTQNASRVQLDKGNTGYAEVYQLFTTTSGVTNTQTIFLKSLNGTPEINFGWGNTIRGTITLTTEWQRYTFTYTSGGVSNAAALTLFDVTTAQSIDVLAWGAQAEQQHQATAYLPSYGVASVRKATTTNLVTYSEDFTQSSWVKDGVSVTGGFISPDGTATAYKLIENTSNSVHRIYETSTVSISPNASISVFVKYNGRRYMLIRFADQSVGRWYDLINGTLGITYLGAPNNSTIEQVNNGWFRITLSNTSNAQARCEFWVSDTQSVSSYTGDGSSGAYIWGAQLEQQTQAETYAPTFGLPVTIDLFTENNYGTMINMTAGDIVPDTPNN